MTLNKRHFSHDAVQTMANVVSTIVAVAALIYSSITYKNTVHSDSENQARKEWSEYLVMTSQFPEYSREVGILTSLSDKERLRYDAYNRRMFYYMDSVLSYDSSDKWKKIVKRELEVASQGDMMCLILMASGKNVDVSEYSKEFQVVFGEFMKQQCDVKLGSR